MGLVSVAQFVPQLLLAPASGTWADRGDLVRQLVVGRVFCIAGSGALALYFWLADHGTGSTGAVVVLLGSMVIGIGFAVGGPAQHSIVPLLLRDGELATATGLNSLPMTLARTAGPPVGAVVATAWGPASAFALAAAAQGAFVLLLLITALPRQVERAEGTDYSVRFALRHVRDDRTLLLLLVVVAGTALAAEPAMTLSPTIAHALGGGSQVVGHIVGAFGVGSAAGYPVYARLSRRCRQEVLARSSLALMSAATLVLAFVDHMAVVLLLFGVVGVSFMMAMTAATTLILERVPAIIRGRIMALWSVSFIGSRPLAATLEGWLADAFSITAALVATAAILLAILVCFRLRVPDFRGAAGAEGSPVSHVHKVGNGKDERT